MIRQQLPTIVFLTAAVACLGIDPTVAKPPVAKTIAHKTDLHGETLVDPYFWLREKNNPEVIAHLKAENDYTAAVMKPTEPLQAKLYKETLGRIKQTDSSVMTFDNGYWYYNRTLEGKQYPVHCRKKNPGAPEEVILDENELAAGKKFLDVDSLTVSDDGSLLAYVADFAGFRDYYLFVKDLRTGELLEDRFVKSPSVEWAADNRTLFYITEDDAKRDHKLWRHRLGTPRSEDVLVYEEKDELFTLQLNRSRDRKYLYRHSESSTTTEQAFLPADKPNADWQIIAKRQDGHEYSADHLDGKFYIRTNRDKATNFKLMRCPVDDTDPEHWGDRLSHNSEILLTGFHLFKNFLVISEVEAGLPHLTVIDFTSGTSHRIEINEPAYEVAFGDNPDFESRTFRFRFTSLVTPNSTYEYDIAKRARKLIKRSEILGGYDPAKYQSERIFAIAKDGAKVPISLVYRKDLERNGKAPCLLYGYGSYGYTLPVAFDSARLTLLDRGVVYAQAHIRGGSDMGRAWYDDGKMLNKKNTFTDFIACADYLVKEKYCARDRLAIQGGSAGGLLIGATIGMRPDVCKAAILQVPFVDVINTMLDESLPLTVQEFLEWGNPKKRSEYDYMKSYCPYSNLAKRDYPSILVTTSFNDSQVMYWEPAKYVAKLRSLKTDKNPLLFKCNMDGGHGGSSGRYDAIKEKAFITAFILDQVGVAE